MTLARWHLLSLDAPSVATLWMAFVGRCCGVSLPLTSLASMFLAVWMLYAADRLLDARLLDANLLDATLNDTRQLEERHLFHHRYRRNFVAVIGAAATLLAVLLPQLPVAALKLYAVLGALLFAWFLLIHTRITPEKRLPKEIAVGLFFPAAIFIPTVARRPDLRLALLLPALLFAAICALNCLLLYAWEHPNDATRAHWTTRFANRHISAVAGVMAAASVLSLPFTARVLHLWELPAACTASALLLILLHHRRACFTALQLRATADLALLTPIFFLPFTAARAL